MTITVTQAGTIYDGDSVELFCAITLKHALIMLKQGITPTRGLTRTRALALAKRYTGQDYKRSDREIDRAITDLIVRINLMKSATTVEFKE